MLSSPIIIFYSFLVLVVFLIGLAPTALWMRFGSGFAGAAARARHGRAASAFARATTGTAFTADVDYVPVGIGFAYDQTRKLVFVAGDHAGAVSEAIIPLADFRAHATGVITGGFNDENYVDLFLADPAVPGWRISCAGDVASAHAIGRLLISLGVPKA
jgi:hypothetical protein